jgi:hypothetical protein
VQNRYGIGASPQEHRFVDACGDQGIAFVPYFTIAGPGALRLTPGELALLDSPGTPA